MGTIIAAFIVVMCFVFWGLDTSKRNKALSQARSALPAGASMLLLKREVGRSKKGVVTYYQHFVRASCKCVDGEVHVRSFDFDHHDPDSQARALYEARAWIDSTSQRAESES